MNDSIHVIIKGEYNKNFEPMRDSETFSEFRVRLKKHDAAAPRYNRITEILKNKSKT